MNDTVHTVVVQTHTTRHCCWSAYYCRKVRSKMVCPPAARTLHHPPIRSTPVDTNRARRTPSAFNRSSRTFTSTPSSKIPSFSDQDSQDSRTTVRRTQRYTPIGVPGSLESCTPAVAPALVAVCKEIGDGATWLASRESTGAPSGASTSLRNRSTCSSFCRSPSTLISHTSSSSRRSSSSACEGAVRAEI